MLACVVIVVLVQKIIYGWGEVNFKNLMALDSLYRYQLNCIFTGKQPHSSTILSESSISGFY